MRPMRAVYKECLFVDAEHFRSGKYATEAYISRQYGSNTTGTFFQRVNELNETKDR